jgi:ethanolamine utilization protein EutQ (cupin superfamily)
MAATRRPVDIDAVSASDAPTLYARADLAGRDGPGCRDIIAAQPGGWTEPAIMEWELRAESWTDWHPHVEYNYVLDGQLFVESGGVTVEARSGDVVSVPAGTVGRYWAPGYARLLAIYGPNRGQPSREIDYRKLAVDDQPRSPTPTA